MMKTLLRNSGMFLLASLWLAAVVTGCAEQRLPASSPAAGNASPLLDSTQLVLVISDGWDATTARLQRFARAGVDRNWTPVGRAMAVTIGRTGLAWGRGLHGQSSLPGPVKREGDGKAPAGAFELPQAFGYAARPDAGQVKLPYLALTDDVVGVDDVKSRYYNRIVKLSQVNDKDWDSAETMRRSDGLYEWGVLVGHNTSPVAVGAGSCIFLHIWRGADKPTAGCTAMSRDDMLALLGWLDPQAKPLLVQLPRETYAPLAGPWGLPAIPQ